MILSMVGWPSTGDSGVVRRCARAKSGQPAAEVIIALTKSRRLIAAPRLRKLTRAYHVGRDSPRRQGMRYSIRRCGGLPPVQFGVDCLLWRTAKMKSGSAPARRTAARKTWHHDLLRFQSVLANSSPDKCLRFDQRDCSFLGIAAQVELPDPVGSSSGWRIGHWDVHTDRSRAHSAA